MSTEGTYTIHATSTKPLYKPRTPLAQKLMSIRREAIKSGVRLMPAADILEDMRKLRGIE